KLEAGVVHHTHPANPATGEPEDSDVGFPGPTHAIAERALPMRVAMSLLALGAVGAGLIQIPKVDFVVDDFLRPSFGDSSLYATHTKNGLLVAGLLIGTAIGLAGIAIAYRVWVVRPGTAAAMRERTPALYRLLASKWYFDAALERFVVEPMSAIGRLARGGVERVFVDE